MKWFPLHIKLVSTVSNKTPLEKQVSTRWENGFTAIAIALTK